MNLHAENENVLEYLIISLQLWQAMPIPFKTQGSKISTTIHKVNLIQTDIIKTSYVSLYYLNNCKEIYLKLIILHFFKKIT